MRYLVDSNILIYHLNNEAIATNFLTKNIDDCCISQLTYIEVLSFDLALSVENEVKKLLATFKIINTSAKISAQAIKNKKISKIKIADNIIAATAQVNHLILVTRNTKDFKSLNIKMFNPFVIK